MIGIGLVVEVGVVLVECLLRLGRVEVNGLASRMAQRALVGVSRHKLLSSSVELLGRSLGHIRRSLTIHIAVFAISINLALTKSIRVLRISSWQKLLSFDHKIRLLGSLVVLGIKRLAILGVKLTFIVRKCLSVFSQPFRYFFYVFVFVAFFLLLVVVVATCSVFISLLSISNDGLDERSNESRFGGGKYKLVFRSFSLHLVFPLILLLVVDHLLLKRRKCGPLIVLEILQEISKFWLFFK